MFESRKICIVAYFIPIIIFREKIVRFKFSRLNMQLNRKPSCFFLTHFITICSTLYYAIVPFYRTQYRYNISCSIHTQAISFFLQRLPCYEKTFLNILSVLSFQFYRLTTKRQSTIHVRYDINARIFFNRITTTIPSNAIDFSNSIETPVIYR